MEAGLAGRVIRSHLAQVFLHSSLPQRTWGLLRLTNSVSQTSQTFMDLAMIFSIMINQSAASGNEVEVSPGREISRLKG